MSYQCPACQRTFDEPGFCPYDGKQLAELAIAQKPTVLSEIMPAQLAPHPTNPNALDDRDTITVGHPTEIDPRSASDTTNKVRALSAQRSHSSVVETMRREPATSEYDALVGETLDGRYYVQRKIGEGGMGVVFAARHAVIERPLAIKVLKREVMRDTATIKRFVQEAQAASRIGHPNIVDVTDFGTTPDGMTYSVMEYVDGVTLSQAIKSRAPFAPLPAIKIAQQIARALGAAHDKGIVHRDLKPENVFLIDRDERRDFVKIVDFGIAKVQPLEGKSAGPRLTRAGSVFGTPEYMAPEQAAGRSDTDGRVDIYALGTILYEMTTGRTPHKSDNTVRTIAMQMLDPIMPPSQLRPDLAIPKPFELAIMKALAKKREDRYQTMGEFIVALDEVTQQIKNAEGPSSLPPLPPGADPTLTPSPHVELRTTGAPKQQTGPRRPIRETRQLHEPAFAQGPMSLPPPTFDDIEEAPVRRWPYVVLVMLLLGGGATALWMLHQDHDRVAVNADGGVVGGDAALIVEPNDGGPPPDDAEIIVLVPPPDGGMRVAHDGGVGPAPHPRTVTIELLTRPGEADVFDHHTFRGPSGVRLTEPWGTKLELECRAPHYKGHVTVVFDGSRDSVMCTAIRLPFCVDGLKNPIDDCEPKAP
ncbi:MAG: serine/threonine-protein kinase [Kofleriaceae bacterium]